MKIDFLFNFPCCRSSWAPVALRGLCPPPAFTMPCMQMFNLVYKSSGIQNTVCKQKAGFAKNDFMKVMFTLYQWEINIFFTKQSDMLNLCLQKHFISKRVTFFSSEFKLYGNIVYNKSNAFNNFFLIL